jgi:hypothetical protein
MLMQGGFGIDEYLYRNSNSRFSNRYLRDSLDPPLIDNFVIYINSLIKGPYP